MPSPVQYMRGKSAYQTPGVYFEQYLKRPITDMWRTGVPAFVGFAEQLGATGDGATKPCRVECWDDFLAMFCNPDVSQYRLDRRSFLYHTVRGFFENGGGECIVVPVSAKGRSTLANDLVSVFTDGGPLESLEDCDLVGVPDVMILEDGKGVLDESDIVKVQLAVLEHCGRMGERFAILDALGPRHSAPSAAGMWHDQVIQHQRALRPGYGALYFPRLKVNGHPDPVPACGHVAGVYARTDARVGVHKAPANEVVQGATELAVDISDSEQGALNDAGVNCLRSLPGRGIRVWGGRTLHRQPQWAYVNVMRLFLTLYRWLVLNTADFVFEPQNPQLWERVQQRITAYCMNLFNRGALAGHDPADAFFVKCDAEINTSATAEAGLIITEIGLAPAVPAEFVVVRITRNANNATVVESVVSLGGD